MERSHKASDRRSQGPSRTTPEGSTFRMKSSAQSFQKSLIKEYALNHIGILIMIYGIFLKEGLLEALDKVVLQKRRCTPVLTFVGLNVLSLGRFRELGASF